MHGEFRVSFQWLPHMIYSRDKHDSWWVKAHMTSLSATKVCFGTNVPWGHRNKFIQRHKWDHPSDLNNSHFSKWPPNLQNITYLHFYSRYWDKLWVKIYIFGVKECDEICTKTESSIFSVATSIFSKWLPKLQNIAYFHFFSRYWDKLWMKIYTFVVKECVDICIKT